MKRFLLIFILIPFAVNGQNSTQIVYKDTKSYMFGQIFTGLRIGLNNNFTPKSAFQFKSGIIGYKHTHKNKITGLIMLDVTRTTHFTETTDSGGNIIPINYFEGSKFTAYLKVAEIKWDINKHFALRFGELMNTQYLTFQDKFWGFRYVDVTFQEKYRFGMPADFGFQVDYKLKSKLLLQLSVVNGEGPFRYQDKFSKFLYSGNIQYNPFNNYTLKFYFGYEQAPDTGISIKAKKIMSFFTGYKNEKFSIGAEANYVKDYKNIQGIDKYGISLYGFIKIMPKIIVLGRYDYLYQELSSTNLINNYYIVGLQYIPVEFLTTSLNYRYYSENKYSAIYINLGFKF